MPTSFLTPLLQKKYRKEDPKKKRTSFLEGFRIPPVSDKVTMPQKLPPSIPYFEEELPPIKKWPTDISPVSERVTAPYTPELVKKTEEARQKPSKVTDPWYRTVLEDLQFWEKPDLKQRQYNQRVWDRWTESQNLPHSWYYGAPPEQKPTTLKGEKPSITAKTETAIPIPYLPMDVGTPKENEAFLHWVMISTVPVPWLNELAGVTVKLASKGVSEVGQKAFQSVLGTGIDKWIATQGRLNPEGQSALFKTVIGDKDWLIGKATDNLLRRMGRVKNTTPEIIDQAVADTIKDIETKYLTKFTETMTGVPGEPLASTVIPGLAGKAPVSAQAVQAGRAELKPEALVTPEVKIIEDKSIRYTAQYHSATDVIKVNPDEMAKLAKLKRYGQPADKVVLQHEQLERVWDKSLPDQQKPALLDELKNIAKSERVDPTSGSIGERAVETLTVYKVNKSLLSPQEITWSEKTLRLTQPPVAEAAFGEAVTPPQPPPVAPESVTEGLEAVKGQVPPEAIPPAPPEAPPPAQPPTPPIPGVKPVPEPAKPIRPSVVGEMPPTADVLRYFQLPTKAKSLARIPVIKQIISVIDKKLLADDPVKQAKILQGKLKDMSDSFQGVATSGVNSIMAKGGKPKSVKGIVVDKKVLPLENAPKGTDGKPSMHLHDIVEYSERYDMPEIYRAYFDEIRQVSKETTAMLEKELVKYDITLRKMPGESDWVYLRRVVDKVGDIEAYGKGRWKGTQKPRYYKTAEAGAEAKKPITYLDPEMELKYQLQSAYNWIIDLRVKEMLSELTTTAKARVPAKYIDDLIDKTKQKIIVEKLVGGYGYPSLIARVGRGEVLTPQTMTSVRNAFPDIADGFAEISNAPSDMKWITSIRLKESFMERADLIRHEYELSRRAYQAAKLQAGPRIDEGWGIYLPGRIFTTQELAGKEVLGRDILREVEKNFGYNRPGVPSKITKVIGDIGGVLRQTKAALDLSVQGIQTLGALGLDTMNLIKMPARFLAGKPAKPTASWISGALRGWQRLFFHKQSKAWQDLSEIKQIQLEMIQHGALLSQSEFAEATSLLSKIPVLGNLYKWTGAAFTWGRNATQTYLYIGERARALYGLKDPVAIEKRLDELAEWSNLATGGLSTRAMGIGDTQQATENILFFSTRLNRSVFGNILHMAEGNYTGQMARDSIAGLIVAVVAFITGVSLALGQKPRLNPLPESMGGDGAKFLTVKVGEGYIGVGSTYYTLARLVANIYGKIAEGDAKDLTKLDMDNPIVRFVRSKFGPPMALGVDFVTGHDYLGELTTDNLSSIAKTFGEWGIPIWSETLFEKDGLNIPSWDESARAASEFFGGRTVPETDWDKVKVMRQIYAEADYNKNYDDLNQGQIDNLKRNHADLAELEEKQKAHWVETGDALRKSYDESGKFYTQKRDDALVKAAQKLIDGKATKYDYDKERSYARPYYSGAKAALWDLRGKIDPEGLKEMERHYAKSAKPEDKAMDAYWEYYSELIEKSDLPKDWDLINLQLDYYLNSMPPEYANYIKQHKDDWILDLPEPARTIELERGRGIEDESWWDNYRGVSPPWKTKSSSGSPQQGRKPPPQGGSIYNNVPQGRTPPKQGEPIYNR